jgi:DNA-binding transcriptional ArsR family regulator
MESETVWRALASPHRRKVLDLLREGPRTTGDLTRQMPDLSRFAVMQHLGVLEQAGLVLFRREGRQRFNYANAIPLRQIYERWVEPLGSSAAETALHLKRYAELTQAQRLEQEAQSDKENVMESSFRLVKVEQEMRINAPRERVFAALTSELGAWWPHRFKPDSTVYCDSQVGGTSGEKFAAGGGAIYGEIVYFDPPYKLAQSGASALAKGLNAFGVDTLEIDGEGTLYKKELNFWGVVPDEMVKMYQEGMRAIFEQALKSYLEKGEGYSPQGKKEFES